MAVWILFFFAAPTAQNSPELNIRLIDSLISNNPWYCIWVWQSLVNNQAIVRLSDFSENIMPYIFIHSFYQLTYANLLIYGNIADLE